MFILPAIVLSGFFYPISSMPLPFQWLTLANPVRHFLEIVRGVFLKGTGIAEMWPHYLALLAMASGGLWLAVQRFKRSAAWLSSTPAPSFQALDCVHNGATPT